MTFDQALLFGVIAAALALFASEKIRADVVAMGTTLALILTGLVTVEEGFSGFSSPAVITVLSMFILSAGLIRTGVADRLGDLLLASGAVGLVPMLVLVMLLVGVMSAFMNNIAAVAILMPTVFAVCERKRLPVSKMLMPLAFGSLLGGLTTLVGTPPNLLASNALRDAGFEPFRMFDFLPTGAAVLTAGIVFMVVIGHRLIPLRGESGRSEQGETLRRYITEVQLPSSSSLIGKTITQARLREDFDLLILRMHRQYNKDREEGPNKRPWLPLGRYGHDEDGETYSFVPWPETELQAGDRLLLEGDPAVLLRRQGAGYLQIIGSEQDNDLPANTQMQIGEVALAPNSHALGMAVEDADFQQRYGVQVLAVRRSGRQIAQRLHSLRLETGDVLLVRGTPEAMAELAHNSDFLVVRRLEHSERDLKRAPMALAIMVGVVALTVSGVLHISAAAFLGAVVMTLSGCVPSRELYNQVDWRVIFLIACMLPLGIAMNPEHTGAADLMASGALALVGNNQPMLVMLMLMLLTAGLTQTMSNAACVVLVAPIAIALASGMGLDPRAFVMAVAISASTSFLTPIGHQANLLVYGVGNYRFTDFIRVGGPLTVLIIMVAMLVIPLVWPFTSQEGVMPPMP